MPSLSVLERNKTSSVSVCVCERLQGQLPAAASRLTDSQTRKNQEEFL